MYTRVAILGAFTGGETWSVNPVFDPQGEIGGTWDQAKADLAAKTIAETVPPSDLMTLLSSSGSIVGCRFEVRDDVTDGLVGVAEYLLPAAQVGSAAPKLPAQAAIVGSLRTAVAGASGRGRIYWPALGATVATTLRLGTPSASLVATAYKNYLTDIRAKIAAAYPLIGFELAVRSARTKTTPHVTAIRVGNVIDTQRRRRDAFPEAYSTVSFP